MLSSLRNLPTIKVPENRWPLKFFNYSVLVLSILLIVWISLDTFKQIDFLQSHSYMAFQFWVCVFFILDFFVSLLYSKNRGRYFRRHLFFLLISIPYLNIIHTANIELSHDAMFFIRFVPLVRAALAMSVVVGYMSTNAVSSLCFSYLTIVIFVVYYCSLIFFQRESPVNPDVTSYWTALWWSACNMVTIGSSINPVTVAGKIVQVVLPICGMVVFPLFTVYITNYVTGIFNKGHHTPGGNENGNENDNESAQNQ